MTIISAAYTRQLTDEMARMAHTEPGLLDSTALGAITSILLLHNADPKKQVQDIAEVLNIRDHARRAAAAEIERERRGVIR